MARRRRHETIPLPQSFFAMSMFGIMLSLWLMLSNRVDDTWGVTFLIVFGMMFIASFTSMAPSRHDV
jgi:hypothetical protein